MTQAAQIDPAALDRLFAPYDSTHAPGYAVGVSMPGTPPYRRGFGVASVELPVPLSPTIRMRIGSTTKHFCALAIMLLAEDGKLHIDDSPRRYLPELPSLAEAVSLRQLMAHTSGLRDSLDLILYASGPGKTGAPDILFRLLTEMDSVNFLPGESWSYNNGGYVLLTEIIERVSGQSFATFLSEHILTPAGMHDTMLRPLDTDLVPNSATLHVPLPGGGWMRGIFGTPIGGMGGIVSTVDDMLRWLAHMRDPVVGTAASWATMRTKVTTHGYGLGLFMTRHRGLDIVHHAGGVVGGASQMMKVLGHELDIIIMTNGRGTGELYGLVDAVIDTCIPDLPPTPADAGGVPVTGIFHSAATGRVLTLLAQDGQQAVDAGGMILPACRHADGAISVCILPTDLRILPVPANGGVALEVTEFGRHDRLAAVAPPDDSGLGDIIGRFENRAAGLTAIIKCDAGDAMLHLAGALGSLDYTLTKLGDRLYQAKANALLPLTLFLECGAPGAFGAASISLTTARTNRLLLTRAA